MGFPLDLALRYMRSKKRASISLGTFFAIAGVALGVAGLATAISVTGGFRKQFQDKVLGVNAHVLVLKRSSYFGEYRELIEKIQALPEVVGIAPFTINPMMVTKGNKTATGVLLKGVEPGGIEKVLDLPKYMQEGSLEGLRLPGSKPPLPKALTIRPSKKKKEDAGSLLEEVAKLIAEEESGEREAEEVSKELALSADAPRGSIVPAKGYDSTLPDDDLLPAELDPDPCQVGSQILPGIVIGRTLSRNLKAALGDCIQVTSPTIGFSFSSDGVRAPIAKQFRVIGIFEAGFDQYDAKLVYADLHQAQEFYDSGDSVTGIEMRIQDVDRAKQVSAEVSKLLEGSLLYTMDWEELNHGLFTALHIQQIVMSIVLGFIIVLAAFTVIATLIMIVLDKRREIAVLKAMGASDSAILRAFLYQGGIIGVAGGIVGLVIAFGVCSTLTRVSLPLDPKVYFISSLPVDMQPMNFVLVFVFAVFVSVAATIWPARHAARLRPVDAFREQ